MITDRNAIEEAMTGRFYLVGQTKDNVVLNIPGTDYRLHLRPLGVVTPSPQGRVRGVVRLPVWKVDKVTAGGAFIEPLLGRPRRVQGTVVSVVAGENALVVDVCGQPVVGDLPGRWDAAWFVVGSRVGLDVKEGATFDPVEGMAGELGRVGVEAVNLRV